MKHFLILSSFAFVISVTSCLSPTVTATREQQLGDKCNNNHDYNQAINHYNNYLKIAPTLGSLRNYKMEAQVCRKTAYVYSLKGDYNSCLQYLLKAVEKDSLDQNPLELIEDYREIGKMYSFKGDYKSSVFYLEKVLALNSGMEKSTKNTSKNSIGDTYLALSKTYFSMGELELSLCFAQKALTLFKEAKNEPSSMEAGLQLAYVLNDYGDFERAESLVQESLKSAGELNVDTSRHLFILGEIEQLQSNYEKALRHKLQALETSIKINNIPQIVWYQISLGDVYAALGESEKALNLYAKARELNSTLDTSIVQHSLQYRLRSLAEAEAGFKKLGSLMGTATTDLRIGDLFLTRKNNDSALAVFSQSIQLFKKSGSGEGLAKAFLGMAKTFINIDNTELASIYLDSAMNSCFSPETRWQIFFLKGLLNEKKEHTSEAIQDFAKAIETIESIRGQMSVEELKSHYFSDKTEVYDHIIAALMKESRSSEALYYAERAKSRAFLDLMKNKKIQFKNSGDTTLIRKEQEIQQKMIQLIKQLENNELQTQQRGKREILTAEFLQSQKEYTELLQDLKLKNPDYAHLISYQPIEIGEFQKTLNDTTAVLEFYIGNKNTFIWLISNHSLKSRIIDINKNVLLAKINAVRAFMADDDQKLSKQLSSLYQTLIKPIEKELNPFKNVCLVPHLALHFLPFQALINDEGKFLIESYYLSYSPSYNVLYLCNKKNSSHGKSMLGMALGNVSVGGYPALPGTRLEIGNVSRLWENGSFEMGEKATETWFKYHASQYQLLHLATHGLLNSSQPLFSSLLFPPSSNDDGRLAVSEVFNLDLKANLVVLSACQTGLGKIDNGDELTGLTRAFMYAGSPAIVSSLWSVDDEAAALIMSRFYQYLNAGKAINAALTLAQRDLIQNDAESYFEKTSVRGLKPVDWDASVKSNINGKKRPYLWAPFVLQGNMNIQF